MLFFKNSKFRYILKDFKFYFSTIFSISVISTLVLMFISYFEATNIVGRSVSIGYDFIEISMHFLAFIYICILVSFIFLVSRFICLFLFLPKLIRVLLILVWGFFWMLRVYFSVLIEGRLEPTPSISYPILVIIPVVIVSILALEKFIPSPKRQH